MTLDPAVPATNGHVIWAPEDLSSRLAERYRAGATLDELAVEFRMPASRCWKLLIEASVELRATGVVRPAHWFDPSAIPLERQREIAEAYRAFPGFEVAFAYGIPLPWVEKIAHMHGVRKAAPRGYRKRRVRVPQSVERAATTPQAYRARLVVEATIEASTWESAVAVLRSASPAIHLVRVCAVEKLVAVPSDRQA